VWRLNGVSAAGGGTEATRKSSSIVIRKLGKFGSSSTELRSLTVTDTWIKVLCCARHKNLVD